MRQQQTVDVENLRFSSDDLVATQQFLNRIYSPMRIDGAGQRCRTRIARRWLGDVSVDELEFNNDLAYDAAPLKRVCLCRTHSGRVVATIRGRRTEVFLPGDVTLLSPPELPYSGRLCQASYNLIMFDPRLLDRVAGESDSLRTGPVRLLGQRPVSRAAGRQLGAAVHYVQELASTAPQTPPSPLVAATAAQHLAASVLAALPNNVLTDITVEDRHDSTPVLLRRAKAFIEDNADRDIAAAEIAGAVHVSTRALQYMFRKHMDSTPTEYLRRVRLHHAHLELLAAERSRTTVSSIAANWGFGHTGRFAVYYRQVYGQSPQMTLRSGC